MSLKIEVCRSPYSAKLQADDVTEAAIIIALLGVVGTGFMVAWHWAAARWPSRASNSQRRAVTGVASRPGLEVQSLTNSATRKLLPTR